MVISMSQSCRMSLVESITNIVAGYFVAVAAQIIIFPIVGVQANLKQNLLIAVLFSVVSLVRNYILRRMFNWFDTLGWPLR